MLDFMGFGSLKTLAVVVLLAVASSGGFYLKGRSVGKASVYAELAANALKIEKARKKDDVETQNMSDYAICERDLVSRGLPVEACDQLRRVQAE